MESYITKIENFKKKRLLIFINDEPLFSILKDDFNTINLAENQAITNEEIDFLIENFLLKDALNKAFYLISIKDYTKEQIIDKLKGDYIHNTAILRAIDFLEKNKYIDDKRYAMNYYETYIKQKSSFVIKCDLVKKGINDEIISLCEEEFKDLILEEERKNCLKLLNFKYPQISEEDFLSLSYKERYNILNKAKSFLARKGYSYSLVNEIINEIMY